MTGDSNDLEAQLDRRTRRWIRGGDGRTERWARKLGGERGPAIPHTLAAGVSDHDWTPQGLGYAPESGQLVQSYYSHKGLPMLAVIDAKSGEAVQHVRIAGWQGGASAGHAGGVAIDGDDVYVAKGGKKSALYRYSLAGMLAAEEGGTVEPLEAPIKVAAGSYARLDDDRFFPGDFAGNMLHVYGRGEDGGWDFSKPLTHSPTLKQAQGMVVRDGEFLFSCSFGRHFKSKVHVNERDGDKVGRLVRKVTFPNMIEAIVEVDGTLVATYESGAAPYSRPSARGFGYLLGRMWPSAYMTRTPLSALGLD